MKKKGITTIKEILKKLNEKRLSSQIQVGGWIKSIRKSKNINFIVLNDGSCLESIQLIINKKLFQENLNKKVKFNSSLLVDCSLKSTKNDQLELEIRKIIDFNELKVNFNNYSQKKKIPLEVIRFSPHFRVKTQFFLAIFRIRHSISIFIHFFLEKNNFLFVSTPIITNNDTEGIGDLFKVDIVNDKIKKFFLSETVNLTVSSQLHLEALTQGLGRVYNFSPCFRAEKSHTIRHLSEFWMVELEIIFTDLDGIINFAEKLVKSIIKNTIKENLKELKFIENYKEIKKIDELKKIVKKKFKRITYEKAIKILKKEDKFSKDITWGVNIQSEHEKYLCSYFKNIPLFITNYPMKLKAFYMKNNVVNSNTVLCFDLIFPYVGEIIGGGVREDDYNVLIRKLKKMNVNSKNLKWYLNLRKNGYISTAGFGLGLERLIMFLGEINIRDTIPFPRYFKNKTFI